MNTKRIIKALEKWSPHGLCAGSLVQKNGVRSQTQACSVGCLALEFLHSSPGKTFLKDRDRKRYVRHALYGNAACPSNLNEAMTKYYGLGGEDGDSIGDLQQIMTLNDNVGADRPAECNASEAKSSGLPSTLARTIVRLRKQYDRWFEKQKGDED